MFWGIEKLLRRAMKPERPDRLFAALTLFPDAQLTVLDFLKRDAPSKIVRRHELQSLLLILVPPDGESVVHEIRERAGPADVELSRHLRLV